MGSTEEPVSKNSRSHRLYKSVVIGAPYILEFTENASAYILEFDAEHF